MSSTPDTNQANAVDEYNAGVVCHQSGRLDAAIAHYRNAVSLFPGLVEARFNLGNAFYVTNEFQLAVDTYQQILAVDPSYAKAAYNMGNAFERLGRTEDALIAYHQALKSQPDYAEAMNNIGGILRDTDRIEEALTYLKRALTAKPGFAEANYNMGVALQKMGEYELGRQHYRMAVEQNPGYAPAHWLHQLSLPMIYDRFEDIDRHRSEFASNLTKLIDAINLEDAKDREFALQGVSSTTHFFLQYQCRNDLELQKEYGRFVCDVMAASFPQWARPLPMPAMPTGQRLRIGYVSSMMYAHTIGFFLLGWVRNHNAADFQIHCYHLGEKVDALTGQLARHADQFHHFAGDVRSAAEQITRDQLHILVHTDIGMNPVTLQLAALRLAPIQCKGWGHPVTTGLPTVDYYLSSRMMEPDDADAHYSETLVQLPNLALCNSPPELPEAPRPRSFFDITEDSFVYLSSQSLYKYLPQHDDVYPKIAARVPRSKFVFIQNANTSVTEKFKRRLLNAFARQGIDGMRHCVFVPRMNHPDFISLNLAADVLLDTFDWSGGKTTLEALACGVPVVTCPGKLMRGRHAFAMLKMIDAPDTIADDKNTYCQIAVRLAKDRDFYRRTRSRILGNRERLYRDHRFMRTLEEFYRSAVADFSTARPLARTDASRQAIDHYNRGVACHQEQSYTQAIENYRKALELKPDWPEAMFNLACALKMHADLDDALSLFLKLAETNPRDTRTLMHIGSLYLERDDGERALLWLEKAMEGSGGNAVLLNNLGRACMLQNRLPEARERFEQAIRLAPDLAEAWFNLAEVNALDDRLEEAIGHYRKAIEIQPGMYAAHNNMGNVLRKLKRIPEAIKAFQTVVDQHPQLAEAHFNLGSACQDNEQFEEALRHLTTAVRIQPAYADAWCNLALACKNTGDLNRARSYFDRALQINPNLAIAHWNRSFVHLLQGDWLQGWEDFEWRFKIPRWRTLYPHRIRADRWDGRHIGDRTLLVHDEQGLGDTLQFARFLAPARQRCGRLILETRRELKTLLQGVAGIDDIVVRSSDQPPAVSFHSYVPLMSLAGLFQTTPDNVISPPPYIHAPENRIAHWQRQLPDGDFRVGLVWAGRPEHANDANRSCSLREISALFDLSRIQFISLQKGPAGRQVETVKEHGNVFHLGEQLQDFADTAGLILNLDLVITVDTSVAHLAGALGRPVWVMIPKIPDWRWMMNGDRTPWYPTMVLFRQKRPKDWHSVIGEIRSALDTL